jgi:Tfp pilus assembly protein FimV
MSELSLVKADQSFAPKFTLTVEATEQKEQALFKSALIGKVTNATENNSAVDAMKALKTLSLAFERERKKLKEPLLEAGRQLDRAVNLEREELDRELGRIENLVKDFTLAEQRRVREEQEAQQRELERIEREKQAELKRIADEQAAAERKAREEREAAERAAREATNAKQREAAAKAQAEAAEKERIAREQAAAASRQAQEEAERLARAESKPIEVTKAFGQSNRKTWNIKQINDHLLYRARPDLVRRFEWDLVAIKEILNSGGKLPGVIAEEDLKVSVRGNTSKLIEV